MTTLRTERYIDQAPQWPQEGRHILAHFDDDSIVVYQAYHPDIARFAVAHRAFGGPAFSYARVSWVKPNFLWMMYRSGWGTKPGQEAILGLRIKKTFFDRLLIQAVPSTFDPATFASREAWQASLAKSSVRLQWDPDHDPNGVRQTRRAIQLGLRGPVLEQFGKNDLLDVHDVSDFVAEQRKYLPHALAQLQTPSERVYYPATDAAATNVRLTGPPAE